MVSSRSATSSRTLTVVIVALLLHSPRSTAFAAHAQDFGFRLEVGDCLTERLDTFSGVFTKNLGGVPPRTVTATITLTDAQMAAVHETIETIRFFDYPSTFYGVPAGQQAETVTIPAPTYHLEVHNGSAVHTVVWKDAYKPTTAEADRLRDLLSMIIDFIHDNPAFKRLPVPTVFCL